MGALVNTLDSAKKEMVFNAFRKGDLTPLERHLPQHPESTGFRPDAFSLPKGKEKYFYINILREIVDSQETT